MLTRAQLCSKVRCRRNYTEFSMKEAFFFPPFYKMEKPWIRGVKQITEATQLVRGSPGISTQAPWVQHLSS